MTRLAAACLALMLAFAPAALADSYSAVIDDLPLMSDMTEKTGDAVMFDNPSGRIVETTVETRAVRQQIYEYYVRNLPALGWTLQQKTDRVYQQGNSYSFTRKGELLQVDFKQGATVKEFNTVTFRLTPAPAATKDR